jgi:hypothetical protein
MGSGRKLGLTLLSMPVSVGLMRLNGWFGLGFLVGLILSILYCIDYAEEVRSIANKTKSQKLILMMLTVPQVFFGVTAFIIGFSIVLWVLYNTFIVRMPQYPSGFVTFGIAPSLILFGIGLIRSAFKGHNSDLNEH